MEDRSEGNRYVTTPDMTGRCCALCGNPRQLQKCGRCFRVFYCSKDCQRNDWGNHRSLCLEAAERAASAPPAPESPEPDEDDDKKDGGGENTSQGTPDICKHCRKRGHSYKICGVCLTATYCSKECQRADWKRHKRQCWQAKRPRLQMDMERGERLQNFPLPSDPPLPSTARRSHSPALSWTQAIQRAQQLHPDKPVLTKLGEVVEEENLDPIRMTNTVFLARLLRPLSNLYQHAWFLEDVRGDQMRVVFCLEHTNVEPHFQWQQLDVGNFLCLEHAYIHTFMDLTRGFRVDDPSDVAIIGH